LVDQDQEEKKEKSESVAATISIFRSAVDENAAAAEPMPWQSDQSPSPSSTKFTLT